MTENAVTLAEIESEIMTIEENLRVLSNEPSSPIGILTADITSEEIDELQRDLSRLRKLKAEFGSPTPISQL